MNGVFDYAERAPDPPLRPWIRCFWTYSRSEPDDEPQPICGDGCPELIFDLGPQHETVEADGSITLQPRVMFVGQLTRPLKVRAPGAMRAFAVRFEPDGAFEWLKQPLDRATDAHLDVEALRPEWARDLLDRLAVANDPLAVLEAALAEDLNAAPTPDPTVRAIVDQLYAGKTPTLDRAAQRRFLKRVGVSARDLRATFRFRKVFDAIEADRDGGWVSAALAAGYFDQPQMARDFRRFLGVTASEWARQQVGLARALVSQTYKPGDDPAA